MAYVDAPEFFNGVEGDDFFEEVVPIVALRRRQLAGLIHDRNGL